MDRDEIYALKLHKFTEVDSENDVSRSMKRHSKIWGSSDTHLYLHRCLTTPELNSSFPEVWRYNFSTRKWSIVFRRNPAPTASAFCDSTHSGDTLFIRCCTIQDLSRTYQTLYFSNLRECGATMNFRKMMQPISTDTAGNRVYSPEYGGCAMAVYGECLYLVGGAFLGDDQIIVYSMDVWEFRMRTREWTRLYDSAANPNGPPPRFRHEMVYYKHKLYIFGGFNEVVNFPLQEIPVFNLRTNTWAVRGTRGDPDGIERFPTSRGLHSIARNPHQPSVVFVHGGCDDRDISTPSFNNTWRINLDTLRWRSVSSSTAIHGNCRHSMSSTPDGRLYLFGGLSGRRFGRFLVAWIIIPKLADMCWDALMFYVRKGVIKLPDDLKTLGLPEKYLNRLLYD